MAYTKQTWVDGDKTRPLSAARLTHLEGQYEEAMADVPAAIEDAITQPGAVKTQLENTIGELTGGGRIVRVMEGDPLPELQDGDLVVYYAVPGNLYSLNFNSGVVGDPVGNLTRISGVDWIVASSASEAVGAENVQVLRMTGAGSFYSIPELEDDPHNADADILVRYRHSNAGQHGPHFYFFGDEAFTDGFYVGYTGSSGADGSAKVRSKVGSTHNDLASVNIPVIASSSWVMMRARCQGNTLSFKVWAVEDVEPTEWTVSATISTSLPKRAALGRVSNQGFQWIDWIAVATGGKTAVAP